MYFDSFGDLLQMGKHGFYVWTAYGATGLVLLISWLSARGAFVKTAQRLQQQAELAQRGDQSAQHRGDHT
ncbi:heme exporter protein CcmD [Pseudomonadales bacterium]|jgi:heme exporter protein D|nr:heme exporter protein CcmD [Pseudomonadales bacterium]MDG1703859.1 heme exporter protein CcmD [Pseudomonadales bacterium]